MASPTKNCPTPPGVPPAPILGGSVEGPVTVCKDSRPESATRARRLKNSLQPQYVENEGRQIKHAQTCKQHWADSALRLRRAPHPSAASLAELCGPSFVRGQHRQPADAAQDRV